jgi:acyl-[acyl-carrier-protein]-phospholipid O-acyltransferase/long-chain-fatty-acid--[acyl-carrier-protein] ligase
VLQPPEGGWHDTGDIVSLDKQGFITIVGRAKRFAKIGGEMISLASVEQLALSVWPDALHAAVAMNDARKGERIILLTTQIGADRMALAAYAQEHGIANLTVPADVVVTDKMPLLGSGKIDYTGVKDLISQNRSSGEE